MISGPDLADLWLLHSLCSVNLWLRFGRVGHGLSRLGSLWLGMASSGKVWQGSILVVALRYPQARIGKAMWGKARFILCGYGWVSSGDVGSGPVSDWLGKARWDEARRGPIRQGLFLVVAALHGAVWQEQARRGTVWRAPAR